MKLRLIQVGFQVGLIKNTEKIYENCEFNNRNCLDVANGHWLYRLSDSARHIEKRQRSGINVGGDSVGNSVFFGVCDDHCFGNFRFESEEKSCVID